MSPSPEGPSPLFSSRALEAEPSSASVRALRPGVGTTYLKGVAVSPGIAIGPALSVDPLVPTIAHRGLLPEEVPNELLRLSQALDAARDQAEKAEADARARLGPEYADILAAHARMIADPGLKRDVVKHVQVERVDAEQAVSVVLERHAKRLEEMAETHPYLAARAADVRDIQRRILDQLNGATNRPPWELVDEPVLILHHDLSPSETAALDPTRVLGFATEAGGIASHTAIVAAALEIPAVVGLGPFLDRVPPCSIAVIDGDEGLLVLNPDAATLERYRQAQHRRRALFSGLAQRATLPARTTDGHLVQVLGNIEFPEEATACLARGAEGVGLYRSEFLYLNSSVPPTEEQQFQAYAKVVKAMGGKPVTIRTLDLGADKVPGGQGASPSGEHNPVLGLRSLRLSLRDLPLFKTQLRAILRASALGDVRVMFPLVTTLTELRKAKAVFHEVASDLIGEGVAVPAKVPLGVMIEVPAAVLVADHLARESDFFSIGTNDLVQYALAVDRTNPEVAGLFNAADPAVVRLLAMTVEAAAWRGIPVTVCGAMGGDPLYVSLLLGLGIRSLSMSPHQIPLIKNVVRGTAMDEAREVARRARELDTAEAIVALLEESARRAAPESAPVNGHGGPSLPRGGGGD